MTLTLTYDTTLSRVRASTTGLIDAMTVRLERSTTGIRWTTVRGATSLTPTAGTVSVDDFEFTADVPNYYRLRGPVAFDDYSRTVGAGGLGTATSGQSYTLVGTAADFSVTSGVARATTTTINSLYAATIDLGSADQTIRVAATLPVLPTGAGFTLRALARYTDSSNYYQAQVLIATSGAATLQLFRTVAGSGTSLSSGVTLDGTHTAGDTWTIVLSVAGSSIAAKAWKSTNTEPADWIVTATDTNLTTGDRGGWAVRRETSNSNGATSVDFDDFVAETPEATIFTDDITPTLDSVWIKSVARPFLNRPIQVVDLSPIDRPGRAAVFDVVGRSLPVAVSDVRGSHRYTLTLLTETRADADAIDLILASGDPIYLHTPSGSNLPTGYAAVGDTTETRFPGQPADDPRLFALSMTQIAPPGPDVVGTTVEWQSILADFATWADVIAAFPTWADVLEYVADPSTVVVP